MHLPLWIKLGMAAGFAYLALFSIDLVADMFGPQNDGHGGGHDIEVADAGHGAPAGDAAHGDTQAADDLNAPATPEVLPVGDAATGGGIARKKCGTCHTFGSGDGHKVGPNLHNVIARGRAAAEGYRYSGVMVAMGGAWSDDDLNAFLTSPKDFAKGSKMNLKTRKIQDRADLIAYLKTLE